MGSDGCVVGMDPILVGTVVRARVRVRVRVITHHR